MGGEIVQKEIVDKAYSFRIVPNKEQEELINKNIGCTTGTPYLSKAYRNCLRLCSLCI